MFSCADFSDPSRSRRGDRERAIRFRAVARIWWRPCRFVFFALSATLIYPMAAGADDDAAAVTAASDQTIQYARDIEPLLRERCYSCHGPETQEGGLRLDVKSRAVQGGDSGRAIVAGKSADSSLIGMVAGIDENVGIMPPEGEGTPLSKEQVSLLRAWIDQGIPWPEDATGQGSGSSHWSLQPIALPTAPEVQNGDWVRNPIDAFVLQCLEQEGIAPSPEADRATLIRRLYIDLVGLPPTPEQVTTFLNDRRPDAYEQLIERVLASEHYGERWARHWLDLARYADSDGYEKDRPRPFAWRYRQWVIDALNGDMPFDQFSIEQIAGDLLPEATTSQRVAGGFHRNTLHNTEGGIDPEEDRVKKTVDRTNTIGTIWLGLSIGCAQCHTHKYDPITQREYYSTYAFFNSIQETDIAAPLPDELLRFNEQKAVFDKEQAALEAALAAYEKDELPKAQAAWEPEAKETGTAWSPVQVVTTESARGAELQQQEDDSILATGQNERSDVYTVSATIELERLTAIRLEVLPDKSLVKNGPGRADNGNFVLTSFLAALAPPSDSTDGQPLTLKSAQADFSQDQWDVSLAINDQAEDGWAISPQFGKRHVAVFALDAPVDWPADGRLNVVLKQIYDKGNAHNIGRFRLSVTDAEGPIQLDGMPAAVSGALAVAADQRDDAQKKAVRDYYRSIDPRLAELRQAVFDHAGETPKQPGTKARAVAELSSPRETRVHLRGDFLNKGEPVSIGVSAALPSVLMRGDRPDRLDFARWLFYPENPLTARVTVNRIWQRYFGRGIVATTDDFGTQGDPPTHPELLDWLACQLRDNGWQLKHLHRLIVSSSTYRQCSSHRPELVDIDPENQLLARQNRRRVEAEIIRDSALVVSGLLDPRIGGPSVRPPQSGDYSSLTYANSARWQTSEGGDRYRRGLYTFFQRTSPYPMLMTFDSPDSTLCTAKRSTSNTPLQALTLMNDVVFFECAQSLGRRIVEESPAGPTPEQSVVNRAAYAVQLCLNREPRADELATVVDLYRSQRKLIEQSDSAADAMIGSQSLPDDTAKAELAAWMLVGRTLMNLDEFVTKE